MEATRELPPVPADIAHLITPDQVGASRAEAREQGKRFFVGRPDPHGSPFRYVSSGAGVLYQWHQNRAAVASGADAEWFRRYRATPEGYAATVVNSARARADKAGVARRPVEEEMVLIDVARFAFSLSRMTGQRLEVHHAVRGVAEGGKHSYHNLAILTASTHHSLHATARWSHKHPATLFRAALRAGEVVRVGDYYVEASIMKAAANIMLRGAFGDQSPVIYDVNSPAVRVENPLAEAIFGDDVPQPEPVAVAA